MNISRKIAICLIALFFIVIGAACASGSESGDGDGTAGEGATTAETAEATKASIGDPLKVGDLVFIVSEVKTAKKLSSVLGSKDGNWLIATVTVKNESKEAVTLNTSFFKLCESDGTTYETDGDNLMYVDSGQSFFLEKINPKLDKTGYLLFAIPEGLETNDLVLQVQTGFFGTQTGEISLKQ